MKPERSAAAGQEKKGDVRVLVEPVGTQENVIDIESSVLSIFGEAIRESVLDILRQYEVTAAYVRIADQGAPDFAIRARTECALLRAASGGASYAPASVAAFEGVNLMRSCLYVGGTDPSRLMQASFYQADCIACDLEDAVPEQEKDAARLLVSRLLRSACRPAHTYCVVRVNGIHSPHFEEDLRAMVFAAPDGIRIPKAESAEEIRRIDEKIRALEEEASLPQGAIDLWCNIESCKGVLHAREIASAVPRVFALALGAEDFALDIGARRTKEGMEIFHARNAVLMACREAGIFAHDAVFTDVTDTDGLRQDAAFACTLGFDGKTCIHPSQVETVNGLFTPSEKEILRAERILQALEREDAKTTEGVCLLDGEMIDRPMVARAHILLEKAKAAGIR